MRANIASYLPAMAQKVPYQRAIVITDGRDNHDRMIYRHMTYQELDAASTNMARGLLLSGFKKGDRAALMVPPSFELFVTTFGLFKAGIVPVFIDPGLGVKNLKACLSRAQVQHFIGIPKAHIARTVLGWNRGQWREMVTIGTPHLWGKHNFEALLDLGKGSTHEIAPTSSDDTAAVLFTSGSTGTPKGAVYSHKNFCTQIEMLKQAFDIKPGEIDLCTFPLFALFAPALGMTAVIPEMDFTRPAAVNPSNIFKAIETFGVQNMFGSPALIKRVGEAAVAQGRQFPTLKRVISAGAPVSASVIETISKCLNPKARVFTPYGATESLPVAIADSQLILGETEGKTRNGAGVCVGIPVEGVDVKIIKTSDEVISKWSDDLVLPQGDIGEICVSGDQVTQAYYNQDQATRLAKIPKSDGSGFYHRMGDLGYLDGNGRLWFCGRKSHRVVLASRKTIYTVPGESIINAHKEVMRSAIVGVGAGSKRRPVLCIQARKHLSQPELEKLRQQISEICPAHPETQDLKEVLFHKDFPVDIRHNSKIFREKLSSWAEGKLR
ncbi:fatty acid CoA ligase family protein [Pseudobacteriovorax antillogorgiicola]|uniref:Acyl-CoA synthetase (AMP-forming)/AMP-acid ligase II n=1 Tax=Pseudobacteriovorax antillogorgiicola TaxID=1513793 RepID=A0A1Y6C1I8_9BACT|nr:fatty acid CoA ligase family protein [Pseudobacteriovorax antillogorgiicola]TCS52279.1 acyl-CoA synthetase (AMP-forming)/AMP-acid ligase II [Pseudobacteriovorax antillogorgiicola]SMF30711.1 Acyl-CoA synthetase (AMP-forming)/AMP-acid ligase II [Pseudobacteriovorax antillogorgiicola]